MSELRTSTSSEQAATSSIRVSDSPSLGVSHSTDQIHVRGSSSSPSSTVEEEQISKIIKGLTRVHSMSDPQLSLTVTTSQTLSSSPVKVHSANHTPISSPPRIGNKSLCQPKMDGDREQSSQNQTERNDSSDFSAGHSFGFYQPSAPPTSASATLVRTSTTESLNQSSAATSIDASPIKLDDDRVKSTVISDIDDDDDDQPLNNIARMPPQLGGGNRGGGGVLSSSTHVLTPSSANPPQRRLAWTERESNNQKFSTPAPPFLSISAPATKPTVKTSPVSQTLVAPTPVYPKVRLSPLLSSASSAHNSNSSVRLSPGNANVTLTSPSSFSRGASSSGVMNESTCMSRATLMDKHKKHMDDLKLYYESELSQLRKKLDKVELERNDPSTPTSARRSLSPSFASTPRSPRPTTPRQTLQMYFPSSLTKGRSSRSSTGPLHYIMYMYIVHNLIMVRLRSRLHLSDD